MSHTPPPPPVYDDDPDEDEVPAVPAHERFAEGVVEGAYLLELLFWGAIDTLVILWVLILCFGNVRF